MSIMIENKSRGNISYRSAIPKKMAKKFIELNGKKYKVIETKHKGEYALKIIKE